MKPLPDKDAIEIYYALESKVHYIEQGFYGAEENGGDDKEWIEHLKEIIEKIGPDGRNLTR